mgnify:CR=1 FL=1
MLSAVRLQQSCPIAPSNGGRVHPLAVTDTNIIKTIGYVRLLVHQITQNNGTWGTFGFSTKLMNNIDDDVWINFRWTLPQLCCALALSIQQMISKWEACWENNNYNFLWVSGQCATKNSRIPCPSVELGIPHENLLVCPSQSWKKVSIAPSIIVSFSCISNENQRTIPWDNRDKHSLNITLHNDNIHKFNLAT